MAHTDIALGIPFSGKSGDGADGVFVEGICTDETLDFDGQIVDKSFASRGLERWFRDYGNCRQMHSPTLAPAGRAVKMESRPEGMWVRVHVVEPTAVMLVKEGVYKAFSVGISSPRIVFDKIAKNGRVVDGVFSEISLVDFPSNPTARFQLAKRTGSGIQIVEKSIDTEKTGSGFYDAVTCPDCGTTGVAHWVTGEKCPAKVQKSAADRVAAAQREELEALAISARSHDSEIARRATNRLITLVGPYAAAELING